MSDFNQDRPEHIYWADLVDAELLLAKCRANSEFRWRVEDGGGAATGKYAPYPEVWGMSHDEVGLRVAKARAAWHARNPPRIMKVPVALATEADA